MRDALNSNPMVQAAVVGVLLLGTVFFFISTTGGGGEEEEAAAPATTLSVTEGSAGAAPTGEVPPVPAALDAPPLPAAVIRAYEANQTVTLLFVRNGGIDDRLVRLAGATIAGLRDVSLFVVPASRISRYAAITGGVGVDRVPALVVVSPKELKKTVPTASVSYGFQSSESVVQAIVDAGYKGPTIDYHP